MHGFECIRLNLAFLFVYYSIPKNVEFFSDLANLTLQKLDAIFLKLLV